MDVRNCRKCGRLYNYIGGSYRHLCPQCIADLEELFQEVKQYIEENPGVTTPMVSKQFDIPIQQIETWIREERLCIEEGSAIGISCEKCGATIYSGRYCAECKNKIANNLNKAYGVSVIDMNAKKLRDTKGARMRFLENK